VSSDITAVDSVLSSPEIQRGVHLSAATDGARLGIFHPTLTRLGWRVQDLRTGKLHRDNRSGEMTLQRAEALATFLEGRVGDESSSASPPPVPVSRPDDFPRLKVEPEGLLNSTFPQKNRIPANSRRRLLRLLAVATCLLACSALSFKLGMMVRFNGSLSGIRWSSLIDKKKPVVQKKEQIPEKKEPVVQAKQSGIPGAIAEPAKPAKEETESKQTEKSPPFKLRQLVDPYGCASSFEIVSATEEPLIIKRVIFNGEYVPRIGRKLFPAALESTIRATDDQYPVTLSIGESLVVVEFTLYGVHIAYGKHMLFVEIYTNRGNFRFDVE